MAETGFFNVIFRNIGHKLKMLAKIIFVIGILASIIIGIVMFIMAGTASKAFLVGGMLSSVYITIGFVVIIFGTLISIISSFCFYGLGEAADINTHSINKEVISQKHNNEKVSGLSAKKEINNNIEKVSNNYSVDFEEENESDYIANLNQMLLNGQISKEEFERIYGSVSDKADNLPEHRICPYCNSELRENAEFCTKCGQKLEF